MKEESVCTSCVYNRRPWSEERLKEGWVGCWRYAMLKYGCNGIKETEANKLLNSLKCEYGFGWIENVNLKNQKMGMGCFNDMLLTKNNKECDFLKEKE